MTTRKYELTTEKTKHEGRTLYRIRALRDFEDVKKGDLGGFVESEKNLSHEGDCWIYDDSKVIERSKIVGCSKVKGKSTVESSEVKNSAVENSTIKSYSTVESSKVKNSTVESSTIKSSTVKNSIVENSIVKNYSIVKSSSVMNYSTVDDSTVESSTVESQSIVMRNSIVKNLTVGANKCWFDNAKIQSDADYIAIANIGSRNDTLTAYRCANGEIAVTTGCFKGSIDEFVNAVEDTHEDNRYAKQYLAAINLIKLALNPGIKQ